MLRAIDLSRAAMLRQQQYMDVTAHNVANTGTTAFKVERVALESGENSVAADPTLTTGTATPPLTSQVQVTRLFSQGPIRETGRATDLAIDGDGFFAVQTPAGNTAYTRNGSFQVDASSRLVDGNGNILQPAIMIPQGASNLQIARDGSVSVDLPNGTTVQAGQVQIARFTNPNGLVAGADGLLTATAASGLPQTSQPGQAGVGAVRQGALEGSNADIGDQLASLLLAQRAYQMNSSAFHMADEMLKTANQLQGP
jgi:flagellar basal-body rod protein FlgG